MTGPAYYPPANRTTQWFGDSHPGTAFTRVEKLVWHTTEGTGWPAYSGGSIAPHLTVLPDFTARRMVWHQHFSLLVNARALQNAAGGVQTNLDGAVQVEIVGTCDPNTHAKWRSTPHLYSPDLTDWQIEGLAEFAAWMLTEHGIPLDAPTFLAYPGSYGASKARMSGPAWDAFRGHCGHQHVPENLHGDPGAMPIHAILDAAAGDTMLSIDEFKAAMQEVLTDAKIVNNRDPSNADTASWFTVAQTLAGLDQKIDYRVGALLATLTGQVAAQATQISTMSAALTAMAAGSPDGVKAAFDEGVSRLHAAIAGITITVTTASASK